MHIEKLKTVLAAGDRHLGDLCFHALESADIERSTLEVSLPACVDIANLRRGERKLDGVSGNEGAREGVIPEQLPLVPYPGRGGGMSPPVRDHLIDELEPAK